MKSTLQDSSPATQEQWLHFGALLRDRRNAAELSRAELATKAKLSPATIKFIETARHRPSRTTLILLLKVAELHLTWADVPGHHEPPKPNTPDPMPEAPPLALMEPNPDPAQFLMNLIGFDEISLPVGSPKTLRLFQERPKANEARR